MPIRLPNDSWEVLCFTDVFFKNNVHPPSLCSSATTIVGKSIYTMLEVCSFVELENLPGCLAQPSSNFYEVTGLKFGLNFRLAAFEMKRCIGNLELSLGMLLMLLCPPQIWCS